MTRRSQPQRERRVFVGGKIHTPLGAWYHATKFVPEAISDCPRLELKPFGIDVIVIEPGGIIRE